MQRSHSPGCVLLAGDGGVGKSSLLAQLIMSSWRSYDVQVSACVCAWRSHHVQVSACVFVCVFVCAWHSHHVRTDEHSYAHFPTIFVLALRP